MKCQNKRMNDWCDNKDVQTVIWKIQSRPQLYGGKSMAMCKGCRKANNGQIKLLKNQE